MKNILIIGATSAIATEVARLFASKGAKLFITGRDAQKLEDLSQDLSARGATLVHHHILDVLDFEQHEPLIQETTNILGRIDACLVAHGSLPDQRACESNYALAEKEIRINFLSVVSLLTPLSILMAEKNHGTIAVISSVAGDRGRQSNFIYGTSKAALNTYLQGLRNRLYKKGVHVLTIEPGFVDTPMTEHIEKKGPLFASPDKVGKSIYEAIRHKKDRIYVPRFWWGIMTLIKLIPERIFKKLSM